MAHQQQPQPPPVIRNKELLALKAYITAKDAAPYEHVHATTIMLDLTHSNLIQRHIEIRFDLFHDTLTTLRQRVAQKTGTPPSMQQLQIKSYGSVLWDLAPNSMYEQHKLGFFGLEHGTQVHCIDLDPHSASRHGGYEDISLVPKYVMPEDEYNQRSNTLRHWKRQQQEQNPNFTLEGHAQQHAAMVEAKRCHRSGLPLPRGFEYDATTKQVVVVTATVNDGVASATGQEEAVANPPPSLDPPNHIQVGQRCEVQPGGRRGVVRFVGIVPNMGKNKKKPTTTSPLGDETSDTTDNNSSSENHFYWVGVQFDEPVGKSDGTFQGKQYFDVAPHYGGFCKPHNVQVGDFPERDLFDEEEDDVNNNDIHQNDDDDEDEL